MSDSKRHGFQSPLSFFLPLQSTPPDLSLSLLCKYHFRSLSLSLSPLQIDLQPFEVQKFFNSPPPPSPTTSQNPNNLQAFPTLPPSSSYPPPSSTFSYPPPNDAVSPHTTSTTNSTLFHKTPPFHHPHLPQTSVGRNMRFVNRSPCETE